MTWFNYPIFSNLKKFCFQKLIPEENSAMARIEPIEVPIKKGAAVSSINEFLKYLNWFFSKINQF